MADENDDCNDLEEVHGGHQRIIHDKFLYPVQYLLKLEDPQQPQKAEEPREFDQPQKLRTLRQILICFSFWRVVNYGALLHYGRRLRDDPVIGERCNQINEEPRL